MMVSRLKLRRYGGSKAPNFYYHLTTVEGCDLPNFATLIILIQITLK